MSIQIQLNRLLNNLSDIFYKEVGGNVYNFFLSVANELSIAEDSILDIKDQININTATGNNLDLHAQSFGLSRMFSESDISFRSRILSSFIRLQITKPRLLELVSDLSSTTPIMEEHIADKWFLGGNIYPSTITESLSANGNVFVTSYSIAASSYPDIYPFYDISNTGTNYGSGANVSDYTITTALSLPATGINYNVTYTPAITTTTPTSAYDMYAESYIGDRTILRTNNVHNNAGIRWLEESDPTTTIASSADIYDQSTYIISTLTSKTSATYGVDVEWWDQTNNHIYRWRTATDGLGYIRIAEDKRIDSEIGSERQIVDPSAGLYVDTSFDIANVIGVYDSDDYEKEGTNYYVETVTENITAINKNYLETTYEIYSIISIYLDNPYNTDTNYWNSGIYKGNFFIKNQIYLSYNLPQHQQSIRITYQRRGEIQNNNRIIFPTALTAGKEVIVNYRKNPINNYNNISFFDLLYAGHADTKFTFEIQIQQTLIKWGSGPVWGEGYKWGQFNNVNTQTTGEIINEAKAAGTKSLIVVRTPTGLYDEDNPIYGESFYY